MRETTFQHWPEQLREKRGLLNGKRVQMAYQVRGIARYQMACKFGIPAKALASREQGWSFWTEDERTVLLRVTDFPIGWFTQDDPPEFEGPVFLCGHDENDEPWCDVDMKGGAR